MKIALTSAVSAILIFGTAPAREIVLSPPAAPHVVRSVTVERQVAELVGVDGKSGVPCTTRRFTTLTSYGRTRTRTSVDCDE